MYKKVSIFGMGLIGGAIGLDLKERGSARTVYAWGRNIRHLENAHKAGACDEITQDIQEAVEGAEIIILATPPEIIKAHLLDIKPYLKEGMIIMDVGSVKVTITEEAREQSIYETKAEFLGCHPIAGSEKTGIENAFSNMFKDAPCIITPTDLNSAQVIEKGKEFWSLLGANVIILKPREHDLYVGFLSHLSHIVASAFIKTAYEKIKDDDLINDIHGPSFRELTRIAGSPSVMWKNILLENRNNVVLSIESLLEQLNEFKKILLKKDEKNLEKFLAEAADFRKKLER